LLPAEVASLLEAAGKIGRYGLRDSTMIELAFGHGLRVSELVNATWWGEVNKLDTTLINLKDKKIWIKRAKGSKSGEHPLRKCEVSALTRLVKEIKANDPEYKQTGSVFRSERDDGGPISASAFHKIVARAGKKARLPFPVHPHQLRHGCGYKMLNTDKIDVRLVQVWLGHRNIQHTLVYAEVDESRLKGLWRD